MENIRTLNFLKINRLAFIACADKAMLKQFTYFISPLGEREYEKSLENCEFEEVSKSNFSDGNTLIVSNVISTIPRKVVSQQLTTLIQNEAFKNIFVPFQCDKYSELRSIYFRLPETIKPHVQIFVLRETDAGIKLECELGILQGSYILFDYDKANGRFKEK